MPLPFFLDILWSRAKGKHDERVKEKREREERARALRLKQFEERRKHEQRMREMGIIHRYPSGWYY